MTPKQQKQHERNSTPEAKEWRRKYRETPEAKERAKEYSRKYSLTPEAKANNLKYRSTEKWKETRRKYQAKVKSEGLWRKYQLKYAYGLSVKEWESIFISQGSKCAICFRTEHGGTNWHTDHCHSSGKVRGILCHNCNVMLGAAKDEIPNLLSAVRYLQGATA
jgi:hypothetical protein